MPDKGGPAFPLPVGKYLGADRTTGMTLRDYFAGQALIGVALAACIAEGELLEPDIAATVAYKFADNMLLVKGTD